MLSRCSSSSVLISHRSRTSLSAATSTSSSSSSLLFTSRRTAVYSTHAHPTLQEAATKNGYQAPLWIDSNSVHKSLLRRNIRPRSRNEEATRIPIQQHVALFNVDQLKSTAKGIEFIATLPRAIERPTDASNLQPFRGALEQQLHVIAENNRWGKFWISSNDMKFRGFLGVKNNSLEPAAWRTLTTQLALWNFDQLESSDVDLATVPVNFRYSMLMLGTDLSEIIRNEALRREIKYPVIATSKVIELVGCSILPDRIGGFAVDKNFYTGNQQNRFGSSSPSFANNSFNTLYNIDEFDVGAETIMKAFKLAPPELVADIPTFAMNGHPILRQLVLDDQNNGNNNNSSSSTSNNNIIDNAEKVESGKDNNNNNNNNTSLTSGEKLKYKTNYWLREHEARQFSDGMWKLKPGARAATLGESIIHLRRKQERDQMLQADGANGGVSLSGAGTDNNNGNSPESIENHEKYWQSRFAANNNPSQIYYFDDEVKERKQYLAALGTYLL